jgi:hypothetical protein
VWCLADGQIARQTDRHSDRRDGANSSFSLFCEGAKNVTLRKILGNLKICEVARFDVHAAGGVAANSSFLVYYAVWLAYGFRRFGVS